MTTKEMWERRDAEERKRLLEKIDALESFDDARTLVQSGPQPNEPGRSYYSNFGFFLQAFEKPAGASLEELQTYLRFLERIKPTLNDPAIPERFAREIGALVLYVDALPAAQGSGFSIHPVSSERTSDVEAALTRLFGANRHRTLGYQEFANLVTPSLVTLFGQPVTLLSTLDEVSLETWKVENA